MAREQLIRRKSPYFGWYFVWHNTSDISGRLLIVCHKLHHEPHCDEAVLADGQVVSTENTSKEVDSMS